VADEAKPVGHIEIEADQFQLVAPFRVAIQMFRGDAILALKPNTSNLSESVVSLGKGFLLLMPALSR
jgi:hypothetical protein